MSLKAEIRMLCARIKEWLSIGMTHNVHPSRLDKTRQQNQDLSVYPHMRSIQRDFLSSQLPNAVNWYLSARPSRNTNCKG